MLSLPFPDSSLPTAASGARQFVGDEGARTKRGTLGDDSIFGGTIDEAISGVAGNDNLFGNGGADTLAGGAGDDTTSGGDGADTYRFELGDGRDCRHGKRDKAQDALLLGPGIAKADDSGFDAPGTTSYLPTSTARTR
jgi:Ca2+-binding RTX toxin-like protein